MFPLFHAIHAVKRFGDVPSVIVGSVLPDVLRYAGWPWHLSHSVDSRLGGVEGLDLVVEAAEDHIKVDTVSDASFEGIPIGWAFYRAMDFMGNKVFRRHMAVWVWALHNVIEGVVEIPIWKYGVNAHYLKSVFEKYPDWERLAGALGMSTDELKGLYMGYVAFSVSRYSQIERLLAELVIRKFNRYSISVSPSFVSAVVSDMLKECDETQMLREIWMLTGGGVDECVPC